MPELPSNPPPSVRFELLNTAVNFLSDPAVAASPLSRRLAFLEQKGLTPQEIELALARTQRPRELISEQTQIQAEKPFNWRGLAIGSGAVLATALLIHQNLDVFKSLFASIKAKFSSTSKPPKPSEESENMATLAAKQELLEQALTELRQQLDGREGAISGRLMELAQEIRELRRDRSE